MIKDKEVFIIDDDFMEICTNPLIKYIGYSNRVESYITIDELTPTLYIYYNINNGIQNVERRIVERRNIKILSIKQAKIEYAEWFI